MVFARGDRAWGISDRTGTRYLLKDMVKEWNGSVVGRDEYEEKHPQLDPRPPRADAEALRNPRPDQGEGFTVHAVQKRLGTGEYKHLSAFAQLGSVTISGEASAKDQTYAAESYFAEDYAS